MLDDLVSVIETLQQRIATHRQSLQQNEIRTRTALIDPLLTALGWDVSDPAVVTPEYSVGGGRADYALNGVESIPAAMVEAKRLGHALNDDERMQMLNYANARGVRYAAVTDGDVWELYEVFKQAPLEDRRLLNLRIANNPVHELALQLLLLWRPNLASGQPVAASEPLVGLTQVSQPTTDPPAVTEPSVTTPRLIAPDPAPAIPTPSPDTRVLGPSQPGWVTLASYRRGTSAPSAIRFSDGAEFPIQLWRHLVERTAAWLWSTGKLDQGDVAIRSGRQRYIINRSPTHSNGRSFHSPFRVEGTPLHYEGNIGGQTPVNHMKKLLDHCGINHDTVHLQVGD